MILVLYICLFIRTLKLFYSLGDIEQTALAVTGEESKGSYSRGVAMQKGKGKGWLFIAMI